MKTAQEVLEFISEYADFYLAEKEINHIKAKEKYTKWSGKVRRKCNMNCEECIYDYYSDTCNAKWDNEISYKKMLKTHKCPYYSEGHKTYLTHMGVKSE